MLGFEDLATVKTGHGNGTGTFYSGYIWNPSSVPVTWRFASCCTTLACLKINGAKVIDRQDSNAVAFGNATLLPGANLFYYAIASQQDQKIVARPTNCGTWTNGYCFAVCKTSTTSTDPADFELLADPGDGSALRIAVEGTDFWNELEAAAAWKASVMYDEDGRPVGTTCRRSWCTGVIWSLNSAPGVTGGVTNDFTAKLDPANFAARYPQPFPRGLDGEYMDSVELCCTPWCDYRREHFAGMRTPLCFSRDSKRPVVYKGLVAYEYIRETARLSHGQGRLTLSNNTPDRWWWLVPYIDIPGSETWWLKKGKTSDDWGWSPMSDDDFMFRRAMCGGKPFCFLMDAPFDRFTRGMTEKFMQRSLAYGVFPGFFTWHGVSTFGTNLYFSRPDCYERDRPLFRKYIPLCKIVTEAGWQPQNRVTRSDNPNVITEQFGACGAARYFATVFNLSSRDEPVRLKILPPGVRQVTERVTGTRISVVGGCISAVIPPETVRVLEFPGEMHPAWEISPVPSIYGKIPLPNRRRKRYEHEKTAVGE